MQTSIAFTPAALLQFTALAQRHALTEDETCAAVRGLHQDHAHGIVPVAAVEHHVAAVVAAREGAVPEDEAEDEAQATAAMNRLLVQGFRDYAAARGTTIAGLAGLDDADAATRGLVRSCRPARWRGRLRVIRGNR